MVRLGTTPTVSEIAALAGVSRGTVSKALNGNGQLRPATRERVRDAARRLGHPLRSSAGAERSYTVGVLTTDSFGRFTIPVMLGIEDSLGAYQVTTMLSDTRGDALRERHHVDAFLERGVDGLVLTGRRRDPRPSLGKLAIPVVYAHTESEDPTDLSITYDDAQGAALAVSHLVTLGRTRIAYVGGPHRHLATRLRLQGVTDALAAAGLPLPPELVLLGSWNEPWGRTAASALMSRQTGVDAVFCGSDQIARGLLEGLRDLGVSVPADIAVVGFDNWDVMAEGARPPLTTIDPNLLLVGQVAASWLIEAIDGKPMPTGLVLTPCDLVVRGSTAPLENG